MGGGVLALFIYGATVTVAVKEEQYGHYFRDAFIRKGLIERNPKEEADYWAIVGWTNTLEKLHLKADVVFFGNSITKGSDFQSFFPDKLIVNLGYPGDDLIGMYDRVKSVEAVKPRKIFIMAGTNDLWGSSIEEYILRYERLIVAIKKVLPQSRIYIQSVLPMNHTLKDGAPSQEKIELSNKGMEKVSQKHDITYIDLYKAFVVEGELPEKYTVDGMHINDEAYRLWGNIIKKYIYE